MLCRRLKAIREEAGLTQRELARKLKWSHSQVGKVETAGRRIDPIELLDWCKACGVKWDQAVEDL
jgi:transcriptional regulator with XRE-family HTH domain